MNSSLSALVGSLCNCSSQTFQDGNGLMISGFSRNTSVTNNEFHLIGENGVVVRKLVRAPLRKATRCIKTKTLSTKLSIVCYLLVFFDQHIKFSELGLHS